MAESPLRMDNDIISLEILSNGILIDGFVPIISITPVLCNACPSSKFHI
jgi:hypothetical protein